MSDVVQLGSRIQRVPDVWQCGCGSHTFWLYSDGEAVCSQCEQIALEMSGFWHMPDQAAGNTNQQRARIIPLLSPAALAREALSPPQRTSGFLFIRLRLRQAVDRLSAYLRCP